VLLLLLVQRWPSQHQVAAVHVVAANEALLGQPLLLVLLLV